MIINEERYKEINYKFCNDIQLLFNKFLDDLDDSKCIDEGVANEAIYSMGCNVASCIYNICEDIEIAHTIAKEVSDCTIETLDMLYKPEKHIDKITMIGENVKCND